jgi:hypothetical protein
MNPWYLAALLAGVLGVATLAKSAADQATASLPKVTAFAVIDLPTSGLNGQWDLWVTGINGLSGPGMMKIIPGEAQNPPDPSRLYLDMIYIPASLVQAQPTNVDWKYTFTPKGASTPWTLLVPASILQAYAKAPKTELMKRMVSSYIASRQAGQHIFSNMFGSSSSSNPCDTLQPNTIVNQVKSAISSFPSDGSDAGAYISWTATYGMKIYNDANDIINCINSGALSDSGGWMSYLSSALPQLLGLVGKAVTSAISSGAGGGTDMPSDSPSDTGGGGGGYDAPPSDVPTDSA